MLKRRSLALLLAMSGLVAGAITPPAQAELVGEFNARVKNVNLSYGAYTAVFESRVYETSGAPPAVLKSAQIRFPRGASIRPQFLTGKFYCDTVALEQTSDPSTCKRSLFATGSVLLDARPDISDAIPSDLMLFLAKPREPGSTASVAVLVVSNQRTPVYASQVIYGSLYRDSAPFGYRLDLPTIIKPLIPGLRLSLAELNLTVNGLTKTTKVKRKGRKAVTKKLFWTKLPRCSKGKQVTFAADYSFEGAPALFESRKISCSRFVRKPSSDGKGKIPTS